jgi:hypothetical protein
VLDYVFFPIDFQEFISILEREGYRLPRPFPEIPSPPARIGYGGVIGLKKDHSVHIDTDRQIIGVEAKSIEVLLGSFRTLIDIIQNEIGVEVDKNAKYAELIARFSVESGKSPISEIQRAFEKNRKLSQFSNALTEEVSLFNFRIVPKGTVPEASDWFEIAIEPAILKPNTTYLVSIVYRKENTSRVEDFTRGLGTTILRLIEAIEGR